jgi:hypothetical protein
MTTDKLHEALGIDKNLKPLPATQKQSSDSVHLKAIIEPALPSGVTRFTAEQFWYQIFTPGIISVLGRSGAGAEMKQVSILISESTPDGTYPVSEFQHGAVTAVLIADEGITSARVGTVTFARDSVNKSITGTADFKVDFNAGTVYHVKNVKFHLEATGPI